MIGEVSRNLFHSKIFCSNESGSKLSSGTIRRTPHAWPFKFGAPFVGTFNKHIKEAMSGTRLV